MTLFIVVPNKGEPFAVEAETMEVAGNAIVFRRSDEKTPCAIINLTGIDTVVDRAHPLIMGESVARQAAVAAVD